MLYLWQEVEFHKITGICNDILWLEVQSVIGSGTASEDSVDYTGRPNRVCWSGKSEAEERSGRDNGRCERNHIDLLRMK